MVAPDKPFPTLVVVLAVLVLGTTVKAIFLAIGTIAFVIWCVWLISWSAK